jgi:hypothetical protein
MRERKNENNKKKGGQAEKDKWCRTKDKERKGGREKERKHVRKG